mgnify:FL=1
MKKKPASYFRTLSGSLINLVNPSRFTIHLSDISHGLSLLCRFSGQTPVFYSVAAHSIEVSNWIERNGGTPLEALTGLLHDASEAYLADLPSPAKALCPDYMLLEKRLQKCIAQRYSIPYPFPKIVHIADKEVLKYELLFQQDIGYKIPMMGKDVELMFIERYRELFRAKRQPIKTNRK